MYTAEVIVNLICDRYRVPIRIRMPSSILIDNSWLQIAASVTSYTSASVAYALIHLASLSSLMFTYERDSANNHIYHSAAICRFIVRHFTTYDAAMMLQPAWSLRYASLSNSGLQGPLSRITSSQLVTGHYIITAHCASVALQISEQAI